MTTADRPAGAPDTAELSVELRRLADKEQEATDVVWARTGLGERFGRLIAALRQAADEIDRLRGEVTRIGLLHVNPDAASVRDLCVTLQRERDEARAECDRLVVTAGSALKWCCIPHETRTALQHAVSDLLAKRALAFLAQFGRDGPADAPVPELETE